MKKDARERATNWLRGWQTAAAFLPIADADQNDKDFGDGWAAGREAKGAAKKRAAELYGYVFPVLRAD